MAYQATGRQWVIGLWMAAGLACASLATAAERSKAAPPEIGSFEADPVDRLASGTNLVFRARGTPGAKAHVRVDGVRRDLPLRETAEGVYEGAHALRQGDAPPAAASAQLTLRRGKQSATQSLPLSVRPSAPAIATGPSSGNFVFSRITATTLSADTQGTGGALPGTVLQFTAEGSPGAVASVQIEGVDGSVPMREVRPGVYEGSYTVRQNDTLLIPARATVTLAPAAPLPSAGVPQISDVFPAEDATVEGDGPVAISGRLQDGSERGFDPKKVRIAVGGRDVTRDASISAGSFTYRAELRPGRYQVEVSAQTAAGRAVRKAWTFDVVAAGARGASAQPAVDAPLEFTSHVDQASVQPGRVELRGRAAPDAALRATVRGTPPSTGEPAAARTLYSGRVRADREGRFRLAFRSAARGTRYEVEVQSSERAEAARIVLYQQ